MCVSFQLRRYYNIMSHWFGMTGENFPQFLIKAFFKLAINSIITKHLSLPVTLSSNNLEINYCTNRTDLICTLHIISQNSYFLIFPLISTWNDQNAPTASLFLKYNHYYIRKLCKITLIQINLPDNITCVNVFVASYQLRKETTEYFLIQTERFYGLIAFDLSFRNMINSCSSPHESHQINLRSHKVINRRWEQKKKKKKNQHNSLLFFYPFKPCSLWSWPAT